MLDREFIRELVAGGASGYSTDGEFDQWWDHSWAPLSDEQMAQAVVSLDRAGYFSGQSDVSGLSDDVYTTLWAFTGGEQCIDAFYQVGL